MFVFSNNNIVLQVLVSHVELCCISSLRPQTNCIVGSFLFYIFLRGVQIFVFVQLYVRGQTFRGLQSSWNYLSACQQPPAAGFACDSLLCEISSEKNEESTRTQKANMIKWDRKDKQLKYDVMELFLFIYNLHDKTQKKTLWIVKDSGSYWPLVSFSSTF